MNVYPKKNDQWSKRFFDGGYRKRTTEYRKHSFPTASGPVDCQHGSSEVPGLGRYYYRGMAPGVERCEYQI